MRRLGVWGAIALGWTALALFFAISLWLNYVAQGREARFGASLLVSLIEWWIWIPLTAVPVALARRFPLARPRRVRDAGVHLVAGLAVASVKVGAERVVRSWVFGFTPYFLPSNLALHWLVYLAIVAVALALGYYRRSRARALEASRMETRLQEARLQLLAAQLQPHFLFNALNTIAELVHEDPQRADRMISGLSDLLRATLDADGHATPLASEIALAERYLAIQQVRFGDRLRIDWDVAPGLDARPVPRLLLQPLLENAILHGVGARKAGGRIRVGARVVRDRLEISVEDDGEGFGVGGADRQGVGLANTRSRLAAMYGGRAGVEIRSSPLGGAAVVVTLPETNP
jgi:signal transduction histidine kinase